MATRPIILVVGPTAGGKTDLAIGLARSLPGGGECICADSMQVYRGMDIGTAKPTAEQRAAVPHHLLDVADPAGLQFSVDTWLTQAERCIDQVRKRGRWPIVVGGSNLYIQALLEGLFDGPGPDRTLREELDGLDLSTLRQRLESVDPAGADQIHRNDRKRMIRAIEVHTLTGRPITELQAQWGRGEQRSDVILVGLDYPVAEINQRINARVGAMFDAGLVGEVRTLLSAGRLGPQAALALGYKQIVDHLEGVTSLETAREQIKIKTRRFAKQQRTWLRRFRAHRPEVWLEGGEQTREALARQALIAVLELADAPPASPVSAQETT